MVTCLINRQIGSIMLPIRSKTRIDKRHSEYYYDLLPYNNNIISSIRTKNWLVPKPVTCDETSIKYNNIRRITILL